MLRDIEDERLKLQEDRARMEIAKTLQSKSDDSGLSRVEIDASVKYAEVNNIRPLSLPFLPFLLTRSVRQQFQNSFN